MSQKIEPKRFLETHREFSTMNEFVRSVSRLQTVWSWGAGNWVQVNKNCLRFTVQGRHHRGHVYITLNFADLFDVYLTSNRGTIRKTIESVFVDDLIGVIDSEVEYIPQYKS